jgi:hypothetical protein
MLNIKDYFYNKRMKKKYPDYEDNEYNCGELKHIWGIKSWDDLSSNSCNIYTMNDIEITYHRDIKKYSLCIETAYMYDDNRKQHECEYLKQLLNAFTKYMNDNNYSKEYDICLFMMQPSIDFKTDSIEELYANFKIYVEGYCSLYGY